MWNYDKLKFLEFIVGDYVYEDEVKFFESLHKNNLEKDVIEIDFKLPFDELEISIPPYYSLLTRNYLYSVNSYSFFTRKAKVDKLIYESVGEELRKAGMKSELFPVMSILKYGYYNTTLAAIQGDNSVLIDFNKELIALSKLAYSGGNVHSIRIVPQKGDSIEIRQGILLELITNALASMYQKNDFFAGYLNIIQDSKQRKEDLIYYYRGFTLFMLVYHFNYNTNYFPLKDKDNGSYITNEQAKLVYSLLLKGRVIIDDHTSLEKDLVRSMLRSIFQKNPFLKPILETGIIAPLDMVEDYDRLSELENKYKLKFDQKKGL